MCISYTSETGKVLYSVGVVEVERGQEFGASLEREMRQFQSIYPWRGGGGRKYMYIETCIFVCYHVPIIY